MASDRNGPTEATPLLRDTADNISEPDDAPNVSLPNGSEVAEQPVGPLKHGGDQESQDHVTDYQGMPEVKARLKYIFPAIAIGIFLSAADQTLIVTMYGKIGSDLKALNKTSWVSTA